VNANEPLHSQRYARGARRGVVLDMASIVARPVFYSSLVPYPHEEEPVHDPHVLVPLTCVLQRQEIIRRGR
jgi:hypothetical protein